jgi:acetyl-CoA decarbonylase/synthase complex subunit gamma
LAEINPIDVYKLLPRTNCKECGEKNCMTFATKLVSRDIALERCPPLLGKEYEEAYKKLWKLLKPPVKEITIGAGDSMVKIGGQFVMHRHELTYFNPTAIAIDVTDELPEEELLKRIKEVEGFSYTYLGEELKLNLIAVRSTSDDPAKFATTVKKVTENTNLPLILCSFNPDVLEAGLVPASGKRPLIYAATEKNWEDMAKLALMYKCPLTVFAPNNLNLLRSMAKTLMEYGVENLVLDPGTFPDKGLINTMNNFTMLRRISCNEGDEVLGFPLIGTPIAAWKEQERAKEAAEWTETYVASMLITRYADLLIMHSVDGWALLPLTILRKNLYTDPRKPTAVEPGLRIFGEADENSPVMFTTNFALTYYAVASEIESSGTSNKCYLLVVDTEGIGVQSAVARAKRGLTAGMVAEAIKKSGIEEKVKHRKLIIPGMAAQLSAEIEDLTGWKVLVGPSSSSELPKFLEEHWYRKKENSPYLNSNG